MSSASLLSRRVVHVGRKFELGVDRIRLPNGNEVDLEIIHHPGAAAVAPLTDRGEILLVRQFRHAAGGELWEIPAGTLEPNEGPEICAHRELEEEAGVRARELVDLGDILPVPGYSTERIRLYLARGLRPAKQRLEDDEVISEVRAVPVAEAVRWVVDGTLVDAKSALAICRAHHRGLLNSFLEGSRA